VQAYYWHLIVPRKLNPVAQDLRGRIIGARRIGEFDYIHGLVDDQPVFPRTTLELPIRVSLDTSDFRSGWNIKYALSTEHGHFPKEMELHRQMDASALADCAEFGIRAVVDGAAEVRCEEMEAETEAAEEEQPETATMNF
jgi:hypothetical protein